ncbi:MAG: ATP-dependent helicase [Treponema sp.]|jgi:DNA helicase-2/ATP-dependent DNA helicase PcrA|nr:ATP-dependent helicase [Treponema sp.]
MSSESPPSIPPYLETLNPEQREAVLHWGRPLLILAGAGSGKTRVITTKIAYLIREKGLDPRSILAVTFTNKAAREMADRARLIDDRAGAAVMRTFHSFGAWFLRRYGSRAGINPGFVIYDDDDMVSLLSTLMEDAPRAEIKETARCISRAKDYLLSPGDPGLDRIDYRKSFRRIYRRYEERLAQIGNVDFGDLIGKPAELLRTDGELAERIRRRFKAILVDEYQDSNIAQFELLKELWGGGAYLCVVGDDDQSIYRFRGAEVRNILEFPSRFDGADIIRLERNYRSVAPILAAASSVVDHNRGRLGKTLRAERGTGKLPVLAFLPDQDEEAAFCADLIENSVTSEKNRALYSDWAILYRTNAQSLGFETELLRRRIPYRVVGSLKFYEREEVKDALALLSFLVNPRDEVAFRRVVNKPARGVGAVTADRIVLEAGSPPEPRPETDRDLFDEAPASSGPGPGDLAAAARRLLPGLSPKAASGLRDFLGAVEQGRTFLGMEETAKGGGKRKLPKTGGELRAGEGLSVCLVHLVDAAGIAAYHLARDDIAGNQRIGNLQELANAASMYPSSEEGLLEFLEHIELDRTMEEDTGDGDSVTLITLHNTKGLEFRRVIMTGNEQGLFPREEKRDDDLEEERRLFYVGATRAMDELYLTSCAMRRVFGSVKAAEPSLFLREADPAAFRVVGNAPPGFASSRYGGKGTGPHRSRRSGAPPQAPPAVSSDGRWRLGNRVFHDDYGYGAVVEIRESDDGPVVRVHFETGREVHFLSPVQGAKFLKVEDDG